MNLNPSPDSGENPFKSRKPIKAWLYKIATDNEIALKKLQISSLFLNIKSFPLLKTFEWTLLY
jgi:hypothetical protein